MNEASQKRSQPVRTVVFMALVAWGLYAGWTIARVRSTGNELRDSLEAAWPAEGTPQLGTRERVLATADELASVQAWSIGDSLAPVAPPTDDERIAATRFFAEHSELRRRFLAATSAARELAAGGGDLSALRQALAKAYQGAIEGDSAKLSSHVDLAERMLAALELGSVSAGGPADEEAVNGMVAGIAPAYQLSQDLMTEGGAAAQKVLIVAARNWRDERWSEAASAVRLAGDLLGVQISRQERAESLDWFTALADEELPHTDAGQAQAAVELAEAMTASNAPADAVAALLKKARRELDAERPVEAMWWASVTLNCLGMSDSAIAAATAGGQESSEGEDAE